MTSFYALTFNAKNEYDRYLLKIFANTNIEEYIWLLEVADTIDGECSEAVRGIFEQDIMSGELFRDCISKDKYYIISLNVKAYKGHILHEQIRSLDDFCKSACEILLLCIDVTEYVLLCKDVALLKQIQQNCKRYGFKNIKQLTVEECRKIGDLSL